MIIHKSHSKTDLIELINDLNLNIHFSHQDNKKNIQDKFIEFIKGSLDIKKNFYNINDKDELIQYLKNPNPKKTLTIKEKNNVMLICKHIIQYCKNNYDLSLCKYNKYQDLIDDMDYVKQFGDIPSVRRCCRLMNEDVKAGGVKFKPLISPQVQRDLDEKITIKSRTMDILTIRRAKPGEMIVVPFD